MLLTFEIFGRARNDGKKTQNWVRPPSAELSIVTEISLDTFTVTLTKLLEYLTWIISNRNDRSVFIPPTKEMQSTWKF